MKRDHRVYLLLLIAVCIFHSAAAQSFTGSIVGTVKDSSDAVIPGVEVSITQLQTNKQVTAVTNDEGRYASVPLSVGDYRVEAQVPGFKRAVRTGISLQIQQEIAIAEGRINEENHAHNIVAEYANTLSPTSILTARIGFARTLFVFANQGLGFVPSSLGLPKTIDAAVDRQMFPGFGASGYFGLGGNSALSTRRRMVRARFSLG